MTAGRRTASIWATCATLLGVAAIAAPSPTLAAPNVLRQGVLRNRAADAAGPVLARYVSEQGRTFVLDRSQGRAMLKFEDSPEVWALLPSPAPRGDVIYKNDLGEPMLRATRLGGFTLFSETRPNGEAVSMVGAGGALRLPLIGPQALGERLLQASYRAGRAARHSILFQAEATPASSALIGDAAVITTLAILRIAQRKDAEGQLAGVTKVLFEEGRMVSATCSGGVLRIVIVPDQGVAGRPSSQRIEHALRK